jgi:hypothetical protein
MRKGLLTQVRLVKKVLLVRTRAIAQASQTTNKLRRGESYGFGVELARNYSLWPLDVYVSSEVSSIEHISFRDLSKSWDLVRELLPNRGLPEEIQLLLCHKSNATSAFIRTEILLSNDAFDALTLELEIVP